MSLFSKQEEEVGALKEKLNLLDHNMEELLAEQGYSEKSGEDEDEDEDDSDNSQSENSSKTSSPDLVRSQSQGNKEELSEQRSEPDSEDKHKD